MDKKKTVSFLGKDLFYHFSFKAYDSTIDMGIYQ